jgi:hypothetical protein
VGLRGVSWGCGAREGVGCVTSLPWPGAGSSQQLQGHGTSGPGSRSGSTVLCGLTHPLRNLPQPITSLTVCYFRPQKFYISIW